MSRRTVWIVDDDDAMRRSLRFMLLETGWRIEAHPTPQAFLDAFERGNADCLVVDLQMPGMSGLDLVRQLRHQGEAMPIIILTGHGTVPTAVEAMRLGAVDYLEKPVARTTLLTRVEESLHRDEVERKRRECVAQVEQRLATLSTRENELLALLVDGMASKQVAARLHLSEKTVANHRARLMRKMNAGNVAELIRNVTSVWASRPPAPPR